MCYDKIPRAERNVKINVITIVSYILNVCTTILKKGKIL